jgi:adenylate cyclase class IV
MRNVEFKAELRNPAAAAAQCAAVGAEHLGTLRQTDTYYRLAAGRLKRRSAPGEPVDWIYYDRPNDVRPRVSTYAILSDLQARRRWGTESLREWLTVVKTRELWMLGNVRIHLDEVDGLGTFLELEAMVTDEQDESACRRMIERLRQTFAPLLGEPIAVSYSDLAAAGNA